MDYDTINGICLRYRSNLEKEDKKTKNL